MYQWATVSAGTQFMVSTYVVYLKCHLTTEKYDYNILFLLHIQCIVIITQVPSYEACIEVLHIRMAYLLLCQLSYYIY